jgi:hypothetical protein
MAQHALAPKKWNKPSLRRRIPRAMRKPLFLRSFLLSLAIWWVFILLEIGLTKARRPDINTNGWPFILLALAISCVVFRTALAVTYVSLVLRLNRYHTLRRRQVAALRSVLSPSDQRPSRWRRFPPSLYGVTSMSLELSRSLGWHDGADRPIAIQHQVKTFTFVEIQFLPLK